MQLSDSSWASTPVRPSRVLWMLCTTATFVLLGSCRVIAMKGPAFSLFDWVVDALRNVAADLRNCPGDVLAGACFLLALCVAYAAASSAIGWLVAAMLSAIGRIAKGRSHEQKD